jgi:serine/threonine-protein kinase
MDGTLIAERYRLLARHAVGGMATVWRARDERTREVVALKRLHPHVVADPNARARLEREAEALRAVDHPAIVRPRELIDDPDSPALVMDFVAGRPLDERIAEGPLPAGEAVAIATIVADALAVAHDRGIVHRDIKPGNILVDEHGVPHIVDFGIAALLDVAADALTATSEMVGTLRYAAPERLAGEPATARTDVWALGAVLYEMLTGHPAVAATDPAGALVASRAAPADLTSLPADMARIVARAMASDPAERYPDAAALRDALAASEAPVDPDAATRSIAVPVAASAETVGPESAPSQPTKRRPDRRPVWVALALGVVLAAGALAFGAGSNLGSTPSGPPAAADDAHVTPAPTVVPTPGRADVKAGAGNGKGKGKDGGKGKGHD